MFSSGAHVNGQADIRHPPVPVALPEALIMDPVTHVGFTDADRRELQAQMRKSVSLFSGGGIVILRLRFGQSAPSSHSLPWCLAFPAFGQGAVTSCGPLPFTPMFTTAQDLDGTWIPVTSNIMEASFFSSSGRYGPYRSCKANRNLEAADSALCLFV
jgi:hypothetical protein